MSENSTGPMDEITAIKAVAEALSKLDKEATARVLQWASGRFGVTAPLHPKNQTGGAGGSAGDEIPADQRFGTIADLYSAAAPTTDADRALVAGYWHQFIQGEEDFGSQTINSALKNLGHRISNITRALETSKAQSPALVMQVRKAGSTKQARKKYKLTAAGKKAVELLIGQR